MYICVLPIHNFHYIVLDRKIGEHILQEGSIVLKYWCQLFKQTCFFCFLTNNQITFVDVTYSILNKGIPAEISDRHDNENLKSIRMFQEKADDSSVVLFILSEMFASSRVCQQQVSSELIFILEITWYVRNLFSFLFANPTACEF